MRRPAGAGIVGRGSLSASASASALPPRSAGASRRGRGFTLVEVLVALAVVAIALSAGLRAAGSVTDNAARLADVSAAQWCADNALAELRLGRRFPGTGDTEFACEQLGRRLRGELRVRPTPNPNFRRVDAAVSHEDGRPLLTVSTVLARN